MFGEIFVQITLGLQVLFSCRPTNWVKISLWISKRSEISRHASAFSARAKREISLLNIGQSQLCRKVNTLSAQALREISLKKQTTLAPLSTQRAVVSDKLALARDLK